MDITRGSRRARHVAATHANTNANAHPRAHANAASSPRPAESDITSSPAPHFAATPSGPAARSRPQLSQGASPAGASMITPDGPPLHRTPDQPPDRQRRRAPPQNPFRLYRRTHLSLLHSCILIISASLTIAQLHNSIDFIFYNTLNEMMAERMRLDVDNLIATLAEGPRLSMPPADYDGSSSEPEPDDSILHGRARPMPALVQAAALAAHVDNSFNGNHAVEEGDARLDQRSVSPEEYEDENSETEEEDVDEDDEDDEDGVDEDQAQEIAPLFDPATAGLKEISNLARFTVSSHKPGNGVEELKSDDLKQFWQSDGPQPHKLTMYFTKRVGIRDIRFYVDYNEDESYTPTKVVFKAGTSENNLIEFATMAMENPVGWQQVPIAGAGGDPDGNTLVAWVVQMQILENHQNGKDTHLRGIKIYSFDNDSALGPGREGNPVDDVVGLMDNATGRTDAGATRAQQSNFGATHFEPGEGGLSIPSFMREAEIR
ncbi:anaphase-promoting complex subunit 10 [Fusarium sporotrichioides]|uniref:Anaphase-promoting complex subunit 10 n=1 Tax=Fusarium sporotrichioides TaxID=5514 RepID=A0A395STQ7_FUSSP|nr:anaphase-promoting complex subunit 10 [Fusarium sporotrichioides]